MTAHFSAEQTPLATGTTLIQASAGTGKTYTITALFLRLLLEHGLEVRQILVTTYTEAATAELRERIRARLLAAIEGFSTGTSDDPVISALLARMDHASAREMLARAIRDLDQAAVLTIHSFCQRVLRERAFESGSLFDVELITEHQPLLEQVADDYWRLHLANAPRGLATLITETPESLLEWLRATAQRPFLKLAPEPLGGGFEKLREDSEALYGELYECWDSCKEGIFAALLPDTPWASGSHGIGKTGAIERWLQEIDDCLRLSSAVTTLPKCIEKLTPAALAKATLKGRAVPCHAFFELCARWISLAEEAPPTIRGHFILWAREELQRRKLQLKVLHFDDLLTRLHGALHTSGNDALAELLRTRYRAALIDEFQDTDEIQEAIFRRIFANGDGWLYLIGDPKQAIYGFRGADVFTYLDAAARAQRQYTLGVNWRSERLLVEGTSAFFSRNPAGFVEEGIALDEVTAAGHRDNTPLLLGGAQEPPLKIWTWNAPDPLATRVVREEVPHFVARAVQQMLTSDARIGDNPLRANQIAVLVSSHGDAREIQNALNAAAIPSVLLSNESIWQSREATEIEIVLAAIVEPWREPLLRAALATELFGASALDLEQLAENEAAWEARVGRFAQYHAAWCEDGFIQMFRRMLRHEKVRPRLLALTDGDRRLTNVLHVAELVQCAATDLRLGPAAVLRWIAAERSAPKGDNNDAKVLRLERDDDAVHVITMHRSKGLEFEVVFCPYLWTKVNNRNGKLLFRSRPDGHLTAALDESGNEEWKRWAARDQLAERVRLAYVALTRAMHQCHLVWDRVAGQEVSAPAWVLHGAGCDRDALPETLKDLMKELSPEQFSADLRALASAAPGSVELCDIAAVVENATATRLSPAPELTKERPRTFRGQIDRSWRVSSFSSLIEGATTESPDYDQRRSGAAAPASAPAAPGIHEFPSGTRTGLFFHGLLQELDFTAEPSFREVVTRHLRAASFPPERWTGTIVECLRRLFAVRLSSRLALGQVPLTSRLNELEFYLPAERLDRETIQALLAAEEADALQFESSRGWIKGFIDLVFQHEGQFFIVDWKSNHLGASEADYNHAQVAEAMTSHHYRLQLHLYSVALHRYLSTRLPGYDYDRDFGGAYYVFLRGVNPVNPEQGIYFERPAYEQIAAFSRMLGSPQ